MDRGKWTCDSPLPHNHSAPSDPLSRSSHHGEWFQADFLLSSPLRRSQLQIDKLLKRITCNTDSDDCRLGLDDNDCDECDAKMTQLKNEIARILEENNLEIITYLQWVSSDKDVKKSVSVSGVFAWSTCPLMPRGWFKEREELSSTV